MEETPSQKDSSNNQETPGTEDSTFIQEALGDEVLKAASEELTAGELAEDFEEEAEGSLSSIMGNDTLDGLENENSTLDEATVETKAPLKKNALSSLNLKKTKTEQKKAPTPYSFEKQPTLVDNEQPSTETIATPQAIGPYKIEGQLDRGGMSILYLGIHPETNEAITVKVLLPKYLSHPEMKERFLKEAEIISFTDHPNIVKLYGHGEWEQGLYIAMEFIRGVSLKQFILQNAMSLKRSLDLILQVAYALAHLHTHGVIHRDLKPENILLTEEGGVKVIDFGIAQLREQNKDRITQRKRMMGTPIYMSPEQKETPLKVTYNTDIYSLGIIAYELLLGKLSHGIVHINLMPKGFQKILKKMLQLKPKKRYQDIVDVISDISAYIKSPTLEKDVKGKDVSSEIVEQLSFAQSKLLPLSPPSSWPGISIGVSNSKTLNLSGLYYDFIELSEGQFGIVLGECSSKGVEGIVYTAVFRGAVRALSKQIEDPIQLIKQINQTLVNDPLDQIFTLSYLILNPNNNSIRYISCGFGNLWLTSFGSQDPQLIHSENVGLGIEKDMNVLEVTHGWRTGDVLLLNTFSMLSEKDPENKLLKKSLKDNLLLPPQKQTEAIMRQVKKNSTAKKKMQDRPVTLISIQRQ
jgi:eukaryotic-like serine/threonine-protein kinase